MDYIPVLYLEKDFDKNPSNNHKLRDLMKKEGFSDLYVIDVQGIKKNRPHYPFYQRFSSLYNLWVDTGPRNNGDVVDDIFSGAKYIIIRKNIWQEVSLETIRQFTDQEVFIAIELQHIAQLDENVALIDEADGVVLFITKNSMLDFKMESKLNQMIKNNNFYVFDDVVNERKWSSRKIKGFLKEIHLNM
jgi:hypothetical protein